MLLTYRGGIAVISASCLLYPNRGVAALFELGLLRAFRGKGYCAVMFSHLVEFAMSQGYTRIIFAASAEGQPVYARQGFAEVQPGAVVRYFSTKRTDMLPSTISPRL